ncbi:hypothetical protein C9W97_25490 [Salmonella enterica subsp. enterica serovar Enteritidis]|nr:hypothetical protein [Salmonella enterica subsp. enterica serovar Enteritidis]
MARELPARILIGLTRLVALVTRANVAFGGILTLGLEGSRDFVTIAKPAEFVIHDSHTRFLAGLWVGIGFLFLASSIWLLARGAKTSER